MNDKVYVVTYEDEGISEIRKIFISYESAEKYVLSIPLTIYHYKYENKNNPSKPYICWHTNECLVKFKEYIDEKGYSKIRSKRILPFENKKIYPKKRLRSTKHENWFAYEEVHTGMYCISEMNLED